MTTRSLTDRFRHTLFRSGIYNLTLRASLLEPHATLPILFSGNAERGQALRAGELIKTLKVMERPASDAQPDSTLTDHVQRFRWLADLEASGLNTAATVARELTALWIDEHARWNAVSWDINVLAERIGHWLIYVPFLLNDGDEIFRDALLSSLHRQARHLRRAEAMGELFEDGFARARAGIFYGLMFSGGAGQTGDALARLAARIDDEILPDGGHRSRSPSRHMDALGILIEIRTALSGFGQGVPVWLQTAIDRMAPLMRTYRHGDGGLCLFNGSFPVGRDDVDRTLLLADAKGRAVANASHSGFQRLATGQTVVIVDTGVPDQGGEAESAGTLAFEFSNGRHRIVVNCGTPVMASPSLREICRRSAAHSTLILADTNSSELLGASSMGERRARRTESTRHEVDKNILVESGHDGYQSQFGAHHQRAVYLSADGLDLRGEDILTGNRLVEGALRFHLHPDVNASLVEDGGTVLLRTGKTLGWRFQASLKNITLEDSVYFGDGLRRQCQQIVIAFMHDSEMTSLKWRFQREK